MVCLDELELLDPKVCMDQSAYLLDYFKNKFNVVLHDDWLKNVLDYLQSIGVCEIFIFSVFAIFCSVNRVSWVPCFF